MTSQTNPTPVLAMNLSRARAFEGFTLFDVGASRGIDKLWSAFGDTLVAYGFDPLVAEMQRLNAASASPKIRYFDAFIARDSAAVDDRRYKLTDLLPRTSAMRAQEIAEADYVKERYNLGADVQFSSNRYSLDEFTLREGITSVDFIKTDTDGYDYSVLLGAEKTLRTCGVLGLAVEVFFTLPPHEEANLFSNVDRYLQSQGFKLFDIDVRRYSKDALPLKFRHGIAGQTIRGQAVWADTVFLRDFASPEYRASGKTPSAQELLKMLSLFEIFGLNDCAVELLNAYQDAIAAKFDVDQLRSILVEEATGGIADYNTYMKTFETYMKERRFPEFPDDWTVLYEGFLVENSKNRSEHAFRNV